jgi:hypothetical protein
MFAEYLNNGSVKDAVMYGREHLREHLEKPEVT